MSSFRPTLDRALTRERLKRLLVPGPIASPLLEARLPRLEQEFDSYAASYPLPLWAPGLVPTREMHALTEALFPFAPLRRAFTLLVEKSCRFTPLVEATYLASSPTWLDLLSRLQGVLRTPNPARALRRLAVDPGARECFLFALFLPRHYGGAFDRYPRQSAWISSWLCQNRKRLRGGVRALDSACGSGEGCYGLSELLMAGGFGEGGVVHGSTLEPLELFAGAHAFFPHDPRREEEFRRRVAPLLSAEAPALEFYLDDLGTETEREPYDLVLCNGLLGGPLLHGAEELSRAVRTLAAKLAPGGVLLAADRFHEGWRLRVPTQMLRGVLRENGLVTLEVPEGVAGRKG